MNVDAHVEGGRLAEFTATGDGDGWDWSENSSQAASAAVSGTTRVIASGNFAQSRSEASSTS